LAVTNNFQSWTSYVVAEFPNVARLKRASLSRKASSARFRSSALANTCAIVSLLEADRYVSAAPSRALAQRLARGRSDQGPGIRTCRRWAPLISPSTLSAGILTKRPEISTRSVSTLNHSSNSVCIVSLASCICQSRYPQSPSLVLKTIALVIVPFYLPLIYFGFPYSYDFYCSGVNAPEKKPPVRLPGVLLEGSETVLRVTVQ
jgi:hypothetical protein